MPVLDAATTKALALEIAASLPPVDKGTRYDLFIGGGRTVQTITLVGDDHGCFPPQAESCAGLSRMIRGLVDGISALANQAQNDTGTCTELALDSIVEIAESVTLLTQLSDAIQQEAMKAARGK